MSKTNVSTRLLVIPASPIRKLASYAKAAKKNGVRILHLNIGDPDIKTPEIMIKVLNDWTQNPIGYSQSHGEPVFLEALKFYYHKIGYKFIGKKNIQVTTGGSEAISMTFFAVAEPGDQIIVFEPFYANYNSYAAVNNIRLVPITTEEKTGFHLPPKSEIEKKINKKTKAIIICNPSNPTGTVYTKQEMDMLAELCEKYNLFFPVIHHHVQRKVIPKNYVPTTHIHKKTMLNLLFLYED